MESKMREFFLENPARFVFRLFLFSVVLCLILNFMPTWFNIVFMSLLALVLIKKIKKYESKDEKKQEKTVVIDYEMMYAEYGDLVSRKIEELGVDKNHIHSDWFYSFYEHLYEASKLCNKSKFTDFHIAACIIFSLVVYTDDIEHVDIIYKCVRELIANPRVYTNHIDDDNEITLKVLKTLKEVDITLIEETISTAEFAKIIKELYIKNKTGKALVELADFLKRVYLSCI